MALGSDPAMTSRNSEILGPHVAFYLVGGGGDRLVDRLPLLGAAGDHVADRPLHEHLVADVDRRRIAGQRRDHLPAWRIIVERAFGRGFFGPGLRSEEHT